MKSHGATLADAEVGHRTASLGHLGHIAIQLGRKLAWNPDQERFVDDDEANRMLALAAGTCSVDASADVIARRMHRKHESQRDSSPLSRMIHTLYSSERDETDAITRRNPTPATMGHAASAGLLLLAIGGRAQEL